jgi:hypothetical protein
MQRLPHGGAGSLFCFYLLYLRGQQKTFETFVKHECDAWQTSDNQNPNNPMWRKSRCIVVTELP